MKAANFAIVLLFARFAAGDETAFSTLAEDYSAKARIVEKLDRIVVTNVNIQNQVLPDAIALLQKEVPGGGLDPIKVDILVFDEESDGDDPFSGKSEPPAVAGEAESTSLKRVSLQAASISFARAVDHLCRDSEFRWLIKIDDEGKPSLNIEPAEMAMLEELGNEEAFPNGEPPIDLKDPSERDLLFSYWYMNMNTVVESLERHTGHKFKPVGKMQARPDEILEEQAAFLKAFHEETERIAKEQEATDAGPEH